MHSFNICLPLQKDAGTGKAYTKISEVDQATGMPRTRFKLKGVASNSRLDRDMEVVTNACLDKIVAKIRAKKIPIFGNHQHDWENMIGYTNEAERDADQVWAYIYTDYAETNPKVNQLIGKLDAEMPVMLSIGGKVITKNDMYSQEAGQNVKAIEDVDLFEVSVVGIGANPYAYMSVSEQIAKSFKEEEGVKTTMEKSAAQSGILSYGKLGETTPQSHCPKCGYASELRAERDGKAIYFCQQCEAEFEVRQLQDKPVPVNQPTGPNPKTVDNQVQDVLGRKAAKEVTLKKGGHMGKDMKESDEAKPKDDANAISDDKPESQDMKGKVETGESPSDVQYGTFKEFMTRYLAEVKAGLIKQEGITVPPGMESDQSKNTVTPGYAPDAAKPVHAKSAQHFDAMKKHIKSDAAPEGIVSEAQKEANDSESDVSFKGFRYQGRK